jgi:hypothetical protein
MPLSVRATRLQIGESADRRYTIASLQFRWFVTDLINRIVQILKQDLRQLKISAQDAKLMELVES